MRAVLRLILLLAAVALGMTPATAHGGYGGPAASAHCAPSTVAATSAPDHHAGHAGHPQTAEHATALCLCALMTTLATAEEPRPPRFRHATLSRPDGTPLFGRALPPADRPPRS